MEKIELRYRYRISPIKSFVFIFRHKKITSIPPVIFLKFTDKIFLTYAKTIMVGLNGLEPSTSALSEQRSNQLSYRPMITLPYIDFLSIIPIFYLVNTFLNIQLNYIPVL